MIINTWAQAHDFKDKLKSGTEKTDDSNAVTQNCTGPNWAAETAALMTVACLKLVMNVTVPVDGRSNLLVKQLLYCRSFWPSLLQPIKCQQLIK